MDLKFIQKIEKSSPSKLKKWTNFLESFKCLNDNFELKNVSTPPIHKFHLFNKKLNSRFIKSWKVIKKANNFELCLIQYDHNFEEVDGMFDTSSIITETHKYFFAYLTTSKDFGITLIRPETFADKIADFFKPIEIDFDEHKKFSNRYYVLSENPEILKKAVNLEFLDFLSNNSKIEIEFNHKSCLFRLPKAIDLRESIELCNIGFKLNEILNK